MISPQINRCTTVLVLALLCAAAWAGEPNETPIHLEFEMSSTPLGPFSASRPAYGDIYMWRQFAAPKPAYAAAVTVADPTYYFPYVGSRGPTYSFLQFAGQQAGLSDQQKKFLATLTKLFERTNHPLLQDRPDPNGPRRVLLYAVTQEDAQKMAQAYLQHAADAFRAEVRGFGGNVQHGSEWIESTKKKMAEAEELIATTQKSFDEFQKTVPYRTEGEAHQAIGELDRMLNAAQVEIAGIKAKMQAIVKNQHESVSQHRSQDVIERLDMMYIEESIVLQGTEARKQMATRLREQANRYVDLRSTLANAPEGRKELERDLAAAQAYLSSYQANLELARQKEPKIPARVTIHPVKWADEPTQN
jgi:hypothetical protein